MARRVTNIEICKKMISLEQSARSRGHEFDISFRKMRQLLERETCFYTGTRFEESGENARSIDRVDSTRGYVDDNVVACTVKINIRKDNLGIEQILNMAKKIESYIKNSKKVT